ncbi:MAG TPA: class I SAM-dependent methyltransferase [Candidatus Elarobacter sp.]|jgi:SAM-dependent methyltransferase|nr:class I SAM-dependent methyltransferase [Candidatus Elarobacter sp.]
MAAGGDRPRRPSCRSCGERLRASVVDLGLSPPSNALTPPDALGRGETFYPLHVYVCERCWLVQLDVFASPEELFRDYRYFSSYSTTWLAHAQAYADEMTRRGIGPGSRVVEVASNDGYLLRNFVARGVDVLGVEPASNVAAVARAAGVPTIDEFFGVSLARRLRAEFGAADLIVANNVLAHVPDVNDFAGGFAELLAPDGVATFEFPHLLRTIAGMQFDTVYHEHFSYLSLIALEPLFARQGLEIIEVTELPTHGGSLRVFVAPRGSRPIDPSVAAVLAAERAGGLERLATYEAFGERVVRIKDDFVGFLLDAKRRGKRVAGYGAAAKATTLLNYAGARADLIPYVADKSPHKQGNFIPGVRVPIVAPDRIRADRPDYVVIFPWNVEAEIRAELADVRTWGGRFVLAIPELRVDA